MSNYFSGEEAYTFPEEEKAAARQYQDDERPQGLIGKVVGAFKDFFGNPPIEEPDEELEEEPEEEEIAPVQKAKTKRPAQPEPMMDVESIWSDSSHINEPRGVTDMSAIYSKPVFAQRTLKGLKPEELWEIVEKMRENTVVMLNLEECSEEHMLQITTFLSGAACFQQGEMRLNGSRNYVLTPPNTEVDSDQEPKHSGSSFLP